MAVRGKEFSMYHDDIPSSLRIDIFVASIDPLNTKKIKLKKVLIDTGSDYTLLPNSVIKKLNLEEINKTKILCADDKTEIEAGLYVVRVIIKDVMNEECVVCGVDASPLIGRNLINKWNLLIKGEPDFKFKISINPAPKKIKKIKKTTS